MIAGADWRISISVRVVFVNANRDIFRTPVIVPVIG
jgi:hypothetical protein